LLRKRNKAALLSPEPHTSMYAYLPFPEIEALCETTFLDPAVSNSSSHAIGARPDATSTAIAGQFIVNHSQPYRAIAEAKLHGQWHLCEQQRAACENA
jgi:hypothetical protein